MTTILALWGAVLSTGLGLLKVHEEWRKRQLRVEVEGAFTSLDEIGNTIYIRNLGLKPIIVTHWEVVCFSGRWPQRKERSLHDAGSGYPVDDIRIDVQDSRQLVFNGADYFDGMKQVVYLRLWVAGKSKPLLKRISNT